MSEPLFRGVGVALLTCFDEHLDLDAKQSADLARQVVEAGVTAVIVAGSTGEAAALERGERGELVRAARDALPPTVPVIAGIGSASTRQALAYLDEVVDAGASGLIAISLPGSADQRAYYEQLRERAGSIPLLAYHYPGVSAPGLPTEILASLPVDGLKDSSGDPNRLLEEHAKFAAPLYTGAAALLTLAGGIGCAGAILALANAEPERCVAAFAGDAAAQAALTTGNIRSQLAFPSGVKQYTAERFGISTATRMG